MSHQAEDLQRALPDRYRVEQEIGRGGMATVFLAHDAQLGRRVAIKVLHPDLASSLGAERFAREIRVLAQLSHPNILPVLDSGGANGILYYVMPFVEGESLRDRLDREKQLPIEVAVATACEVADALGYAHASGVIHRDIKPENVLVSDGHAVVADFGIARLADDGGEKLTMTGMSLGTAAYMSPEQASGEAVDGRSDLYSLACMLYELLVGAPPFAGANSMAVMARHAMEPPPLIRVVRAAVPEEIEEVVLRALEKSPADRFGSVAEFKAALLGEAATTATARYTSRYTSMRRVPAPRPSWWRRNPILSAGLALLVVTGAIAVGMSGIGQANHALPDNAARVAVTYFTEAPGSDLRYLADALTEGVIDELSGARVDVASANAVGPFRGIHVAADSIGRALDVGTVVRGAIERVGDGVKVTVQLWDALEDRELDKRTFQAASANPAALQEMVAERVADLVRSRVGQEVMLRRDGLGTRSGEAWTAYRLAELRRKHGDSLLADGAAGSALGVYAAADSLLQSAQQLDDSWVAVPARRAMVSLATAQALAEDPIRSREAVDAGLAHADRALALKADDADALTAKGDLLFYQYSRHLIPDAREGERTLVRAESALVRAVRVNPDQARAWSTLSALYYRKTDVLGIVRASREALRADRYLTSARTLQSRLFYAQYNTEDFTGAINTCDEGQRRFPTDQSFVQCRLFLFLTPRAGVPNPDSAWVYAARLVAMSPEAGRPLMRRRADVLVAGTLTAAGLRDSARKVLDRARPPAALDPTRSVNGWEAAVRVMLGEREKAISLLEDYLAVNPEHKQGFRNMNHWWWRDIQDNPRFRALIAH